MAKTSYYIRKSSRKSDTGTIGIRIREGKYDLKVATPLTVQVAYWDASAPGYRDTTPVAVIDRNTERVQPSTYPACQLRGGTSDRQGRQPDHEGNHRGVFQRQCLQNGKATVFCPKRLLQRQRHGHP